MARLWSTTEPVGRSFSLMSEAWPRYTSTDTTARKARTPMPTDQRSLAASERVEVSLVGMGDLLIDLGGWYVTTTTQWTCARPASWRRNTLTACDKRAVWSLRLSAAAALSSTSAAFCWVIWSSCATEAL